MAENKWQQSMSMKIDDLKADMRTITKLLVGSPEEPDKPGWIERVRQVDARVREVEEYVKGEKDARTYYSRLVVGALLLNLLGLLGIGAFMSSGWVKLIQP